MGSPCHPFLLSDVFLTFLFRQFLDAKFHLAMVYVHLVDVISEVHRISLICY